jgi:hypothetical protein
MSASKTYQRLQPYCPEHVHIIPLYDLKEHIPLPECWCHPTTPDEDYPGMWVHISADGREDFEDGTRLMS